MMKRRGVGDTLTASALVRDAHNHRPDIRLSVEGTAAEEIFRHDPRVYPAGPNTTDVPVSHKALIDRSRTDRTARYVYAVHEQFEAATGISVPRGRPVPSIILTPDESPTTPPRPYGVVASGVKLDILLKQYPTDYFAEAVAAVPEIDWIQVGAVHDGRKMHVQRALPGCQNLLGKTALRTLFSVIAGASVVLCHVSLPMLAAAAFGVPCVVLDGGLEDPWLYDDSGVDVLHTIGRLPCCAARGCRKCSPVKPHNDSAFPENWSCVDPVQIGREVVGRCMTLIRPEEVAAAVKYRLPVVSS